jgi:hypothetical protein
VNGRAASSWLVARDSGRKTDDAGQIWMVTEIGNKSVNQGGPDFLYENEVL